MSCSGFVSWNSSTMMRAKRAACARRSPGRPRRGRGVPSSRSVKSRGRARAWPRRTRRRSGPSSSSINARGLACPDIGTRPREGLERGAGSARTRRGQLRHGAGLASRAASAARAGGARRHRAGRCSRRAAWRARSMVRRSGWKPPGRACAARAAAASAARAAPRSGGLRRRAAPDGSGRGCAASRGPRTPSSAGGRGRRPRRRRAPSPDRRPGSRPAPPRTRRARSARAPGSSSTANAGSSPAATACARRTRAQNPWMVETQAASVPRASSRRPSSRKRSRTRARSSPAAFSVNVIARIWSGRRSSSVTLRTKRSTSTEVLPEPAPALTSSGPLRRVTATACSVVNGRPPGPSTARSPRPRSCRPPRQTDGCAQPPP